jgi:hypothetical protein
MRNPPTQASVVLSSLGSFCTADGANKTDGSRHCHEYAHWSGATLADVQGTGPQTQQTLWKDCSDVFGCDSDDGQGWRARGWAVTGGRLDCVVSLDDWTVVFC